METKEFNKQLAKELINREFSVGDKEVFLYKNSNSNEWKVTIKREEIYFPYIIALEGNKIGTNETFNRRYTGIEKAILHMLNNFNENVSIKNKYESIEEYLKNSKTIEPKKDMRKIGRILENGTVEKEYFQEGYIYKNIANFYKKDGICYISEYQTNKITNKSIPGEDYETYQTIYEKVKEYFEKQSVNIEKYSVEDFTEMIFNDLNWQSAEALIIDSIDALDDEYFFEDKENYQSI